MIDPKRQSRRIRLGIAAGLVVGGLWAALEQRPDRAAAQANEPRPPVQVVALAHVGQGIGASLPGVGVSEASDPQPTEARWAIPAGAIDPRRATLIDSR